MLRKRSRAVTGKQSVMADHGGIPSPTGKYGRPASSFFPSPRLFTGFSAKGFSETESVISPTSILDSKPFSVLVNPFWPDRNPVKSPEPCSENKHPWQKLDSGGVGLGLVDALNNDRSEDKFSKPDSRMILFGSQLKIQIPLLPPSVQSPGASPKSPVEFGNKTRNAQLGSPVLERSGSSRVFTGCLSASEMELSEDYTCVITHGPNPRTTHIFDNCIVESCCGVVGFSELKKNCVSSDQSSFPSPNFLSICGTCKKKLGPGKDIYMYRGEKAFCSRECRYQEMSSDEGMEKSELEGAFPS